MIKEVNDKINQINEKMYVPVKLPKIKMTSKSLNVSAITNLIVGSGIICSGIFFEKKSLVILGSLGLISSAIMRSESKKN
ncbi:hypothetical protein ACYSNW_07700 [Enterococcus sp. LJL99]